jgi:predicted nucleotidyltransferase
VEKLVDMIGVVGSGPVVGVILFGSVARHADTNRSDIDLLFVSDDGQHEPARQVVMGAVRQFPAELRIAANIESYDRLSHFADLGDPFVRTILGEGQILVDSDERLAKLRTRCADSSLVPNARAAARYLHSKALFHHRRVQRHLYDLLGELQLSLMARAQALALIGRGPSPPSIFHDLSDWERLEELLRDQGLQENLLVRARSLINAHQNAFETEVLAEFRSRFYDVAEELDRAFTDASSFDGGEGCT